MAQKERYVSGPQQIVSVQVASATIIEKGDFVCLLANYAVPASGIGDQGDAAANREGAADKFWGVALTATTTGETDPIQVDIGVGAVYELTLAAAASLSYGAALEIYASATAPSDDTVVAGSTSQVATTVETITSGTAIKAMLLQRKWQVPQA